MRLTRLSLVWWLGPLMAFGADAPVTFNKDVAPILYARCTGCHQPGDIAPMSFLTYKETRPWAAAIREAVATRRMPPWHADPHYGKFANDMRLSEAEMATIRTWAQTGAAEGDPKDLPPAPKNDSGWKIGKPDQIIDIGQDYVVKANARDGYVNFTVPTNFKEDKWVQAVELRPGNRKVVHHAHISVVPPESATGPKAERRKDVASTYIYTADGIAHMKPDAPVKNDGCTEQDSGNYFGRRGGQEGILASYLPGKGPDRYPIGTAKLIPAGSQLKFQMHYARNGKQDETDRSAVGLLFLDHPPDRPLRRMDISNLMFQIPAGASNHEVRECHTFDSDIELLSLTAHMHYRGKAMKFELEKPSGERVTLLDVPHYSFEWQQVYRFAEPIAVPKGSRLMITAHFDNSLNNAANPDATKPIRWGAPSDEEMMDGWLEYVDPKPGAKPVSSAALPK